MLLPLFLILLSCCGDPSEGHVRHSRKRHCVFKGIGGEWLGPGFLDGIVYLSVCISQGVSTSAVAFFVEIR